MTGSSSSKSEVPSGRKEVAILHYRRLLAPTQNAKARLLVVLKADVSFEGTRQYNEHYENDMRGGC